MPELNFNSWVWGRGRKNQGLRGRFFLLTAEGAEGAEEEGGEEVLGA
jgi:hypothetical protein